LTKGKKQIFSIFCEFCGYL